MKRPSDCSYGDESRTPPTPASDAGSRDQPAKKLRPTSSTQAEDSSSSSSPHAPPDLGEDSVFEVLRRADARTLAAASCVSRAWRDMARDERLWEAACARDWAGFGFRGDLLRLFALKLGGFRRVHADVVRPLQMMRASAHGSTLAPVDDELEFRLEALFLFRDKIGEAQWRSQLTEAWKWPIKYFS